MIKISNNFCSQKNKIWFDKNAYALNNILISLWLKMKENWTSIIHNFDKEFFSSRRILYEYIFIKRIRLSPSFPYFVFILFPYWIVSLYISIYIYIYDRIKHGLYESCFVKKCKYKDIAKNFVTQCRIRLYKFLLLLGENQSRIIYRKRDKKEKKKKYFTNHNCTFLSRLLNDNFIQRILR